MKRALALSISLSLLLTAFIPVGASAEVAAEESKTDLVKVVTTVSPEVTNAVLTEASESGLDSSLEKAILDVKAKITIPEDYTDFKYQSAADENSKVWTLTWTKKGINQSSINVYVNSAGEISNYSNYAYTFSDGSRRLPKVAYEDALKIAQEFIERMSPGLLRNLKLQQNGNNAKSFFNTEYNFSFNRLENGVTFPNNSVYVSVDQNSGKVIYYNKSWNEGLVFPVPENLITMEEAQKAYQSELGLKLHYNYTYDSTNSAMRIYPVYDAVYGYNYYIDATTGKGFKEDSPYYYTMGKGSAEMATSDAYRQNSGTYLTPGEISAIDKLSGLLSQVLAEEKARSIGLLKLTDEYKVTGARLIANYYDNNEFTWSLDFEKSSADVKELYKNISISLDAKTGEPINFYINGFYDGTTDPKVEEAEAKAAVEEFLKELLPLKFSKTDYLPDEASITFELSGEKPRSFTFNYVRMVNGIQFPGNNISVTYDAVNDRIISMQSNWFTNRFPSLSKVISKEKAFDTLFGEVGLELIYVPEYDMPKDLSKIMPVSMPTPSGIRLAYALKSDVPSTIDANRGVILDYDGKAYVKPGASEYKDIVGHYAENQIKVLGEYGISLGGDVFKPDESILQKDFLRVLVATMSYYSTISANPTDTEIEELYQFMIREKVILESEKAPESTVTREQAIRFIIRSIKYSEVAEIQGIFLNSFEDSEELSPDMGGYVAIAKGLGIINGHGGRFTPKGLLKRADAMIMIYNTLRR